MARPRKNPEDKKTQRVTRVKKLKDLYLKDAETILQKLKIEECSLKLLLFLARKEAI